MIWNIKHLHVVFDRLGGSAGANEEWLVLDRVDDNRGVLWYSVKKISMLIVYRTFL